MEAIAKLVNDTGAPPAWEDIHDTCSPQERQQLWKALGRDVDMKEALTLAGKSVSAKRKILSEWLFRSVKRTRKYSSENANKNSEEWVPLQVALKRYGEAELKSRCEDGSVAVQRSGPGGKYLEFALVRNKRWRLDTVADCQDSTDHPATASTPAPQPHGVMGASSSSSSSPTNELMSFLAKFPIRDNSSNEADSAAPSPVAVADPPPDPFITKGTKDGRAEGKTKREPKPKAKSKAKDAPGADKGKGTSSKKAKKPLTVVDVKVVLEDTKILMQYQSEAFQEEHGQKLKDVEAHLDMEEANVDTWNADMELLRNLQSLSVWDIALYSEHITASTDFMTKHLQNLLDGMSTDFLQLPTAFQAQFQVRVDQAQEEGNEFLEAFRSITKAGAINIMKRNYMKFQKRAPHPTHCLLLHTCITGPQFFLYVPSRSLQAHGRFV